MSRLQKNIATILGNEVAAPPPLKRQQALDTDPRQAQPKKAEPAPQGSPPPLQRQQALDTDPRQAQPKKVEPPKAPPPPLQQQPGVAPDPKQAQPQEAEPPNAPPPPLQRQPGVAPDPQQAELKKEVKRLEGVLKTLVPAVVEARAAAHPDAAELITLVKDAYVEVRARDVDAAQVLVTKAQKLLTKEKGTEYIGEEVGFSHGKKDPRVFKADKTKADGLADEASVVTDYSKDPAQSETHVEGGRLLDAANNPLSGTQGFVTNPETGKLHQFAPDTSFIENTVTGERRPHTGKFDPKLLGPNERFLKTHHTTPLAGKAVAGAGEITTKDGKIVKIKDQSGHYKPEAELTHQTVQVLKDQGANLRDAKVELGGKGLTEEEFREVKGNVSKINELLKKKLGISEALDTNLYSDDDRELSDMTELNKLIFTGMKTVTVPAEAFLQTGGNEKAIRQKDAVNYDLNFLNPEQWDEIKGKREKINNFFAEALGGRELLPESTTPDELNSYPKIKLLYVKALKEKQPELEREGSGLGQPDLERESSL